MAIVYLLLCTTIISLSSNVDASGDETLTMESEETKSTTKKPTALRLAYAQFSLLVSKGGSFHKISLKQTSKEEDGDMGLGVFASQDIEKGDLLMKVPVSVILGGGE